MLRKKLSLLFVVALSGAALLVFAGCGSSNNNNNSGGGSSSGTTAPADTSAPASTPTSTGNKQADAAIKAAVASCKSSVDAVPQLSASTKTDLEGLCDKAASGNIKDIQSATEQVCEKIIKDTVPASAQTQALAACKSASGG